MSVRTVAAAADKEIDLRVLLKSLARALPFVIVFALIVAVGTFYLLSQIPPSYKATTTLLIETPQPDPMQTEADPTAAAQVIDKEAVASQVQLILSRDLARVVARKLDLAAKPEYRKAVEGKSLIGDLLAGIGLGSEASSSSVEERVLAAYYKNLSVYQVEGARVIAIEFSSTDPELAAEGANTIAAEYIALQQTVKRDTGEDAANRLETEIADLRTKVTEAERRVEDYRSAQGLFASGTQTATTLPQQQLADLNAELTRVRAAKAEAEAKAAQIRASLDSGTVPNISEVLNSPLIQRLIEQQVALRARIAEQSATYLAGHPRMRELSAQIADLDRQVKSEAQKIVAALDAESRLALAREQEILASLDQLKVAAAGANDAGVELRALEREAAAQRDLLDTYLRRYREALARQNGDYLPTDARVISRAAVPIRPDFPKVVAMTAAATIAALILAIAFVLIRELASGRPMRPAAFGETLPLVPDAVPVRSHVRWADDRGVRRMMPAAPTLAPPITSETERALAAIADQLVAEERRRIMVTLAEGSDEGRRPLAAVALARALARADRRVVLVDLRGDGADGATMGQAADLPGFTDLFTGEASFAQAIFRDRRSRAHFIPSGRQPLVAGMLTSDRLATILDALDHTYDHLVIDVSDDLVGLFGPSAGAALVVTEFGAADPRTVRAFDRIKAVSAAAILILVVDKEVEDEATRTAAPAGAAA